MILFKFNVLTYQTPNFRLMTILIL